MIDTVLDWIFSSIAWLWYHWYLVVGVIILGAVLEKIFPCIWSHDYQKRIENYHDSPNVTSYTLGFYCSRCDKRYYS